MRRNCLIVLFAIVIVAAAYWLVRTHGSGDILKQACERIAVLKAEVEQQRKVSEQAALGYKPAMVGAITDLSTPAEALLRQLPGVAEVQTAVAAAKPAHRMIRLRDWPYVSRDLFALDLREAHGRVLSEEEIHALHEEHCCRSSWSSWSRWLCFAAWHVTTTCGSCWPKA
jgi:hypothetical protein